MPPKRSRSDSAVAPDEVVGKRQVLDSANLFVNCNASDDPTLGDQDSTSEYEDAVEGIEGSYRSHEYGSKLSEATGMGSAVVDSDDSDAYLEQMRREFDSGSESPPYELSDLGFSSDEEYEINDEEMMETASGLKDAIHEAAFHKNKRRRTKRDGLQELHRKMKRRHKDRELDPEVRILLSQANEAFVRNDIHVAQDLYKEVIQKDPKNFGAYKTLGEIYKLQGKFEECCTAWFCAAHINNWDFEFWASVAELSHELGNSTQAIYCFKRGISASNGSDVRSIFNRAVIYREIGHTGRALEGFQKLHKAVPTDIDVVKELALCYVDQNRTADAISLYTRIFRQNMENEEGEYPVVEWSELNILAELYSKLGLWEPCLLFIKTAARWLSNRVDETWWDPLNDAEFDEERYPLDPKFLTLSPEQQARNHHLPIDIRVKCGFCRLYLKQDDEALKHFDNLLQEDVEHVHDLFVEVGMALEQQGMYEEALRYLKPLLAYPYDPDLNLELSVASCQLQIGEYAEAEQGYLHLLANDPTNLEIMLELAEITFHMGKMVRSRQYLDEVAVLRKAQKLAEGEAALVAEPEEHFSEEEAEAGEEPSNMAMHHEPHRKPKRAFSKVLDDERVEQQRVVNGKVLRKFATLERFWPSIKEDIPRATWIQLASQLIEMFFEEQGLLRKAKDKTKRSVAVYLKNRRNAAGIDEKLARANSLYDSALVSRPKGAANAQEHRGVANDRWFQLLMRYALVLTLYEGQDGEAVSVLELARTSHVARDPSWDQTILVVRLAVCTITKDYHGIMNNIRTLLNHNQFNSKVLRFFMLVLPSGNEAARILTSLNHQKFFLRQIKAFDSLKQGIPMVSGMATISNKDVYAKTDNPYLLHIYYCLLSGGKSYVPSLGYALRCYKHFNKDPMVCLMVGLGHLHRSMQRLSLNRHYQVLQGFSYLMEYAALRAPAGVYETQEVSYNFGRAFHMLGLTNIAVGYYEEVLAVEGLDDVYDLRAEAAYNLSLIYAINGNMELAARLTERYLTI